MIRSPTESALNLINNAQFKASEAAHTIATLPVSDDEVGSSNFSSKDLLTPIISLKEAELEASAAVQILQTEQETVGSLFDAMV